MRTVAGGVIYLACLATTASGLAAADVQGTARVAERPEPHAIVWLEAPTAQPFASSKRIVLDQRNLTFSPHVLAVHAGTTVAFPNNDRVFHNVFSFRDGKRFDLGMYPVGTTRLVTFDQPGLSRIFCNIHPNMAAYVMALDTPYFAVADRFGAFTIAGVPPGLYSFKAWRPGGTILNGAFNAGAGIPLDIRWP